MKVAPFRDPRVYGRLLLSAAFRSLLRLSSAFSAKAFPSCYVYLNLINPLWTSSKVFLLYTEAFVMVLFMTENEELKGFSELQS